MVGAATLTLPMLVLFVLLQRYFISGITALQVWNNESKFMDITNLHSSNVISSNLLNSLCEALFTNALIFPSLDASLISSWDVSGFVRSPIIRVDLTSFFLTKFTVSSAPSLSVLAWTNILYPNFDKLSYYQPRLVSKIFTTNGNFLEDYSNENRIFITPEKIGF